MVIYNQSLLLRRISMLAIQPQVEVQHNLLTRLADARAQTDKLFDIVRPEALYARPIPERHRIVFYIGHLEAFDWNLLSARLPGLKPFHPQFDQLFAFGIDPVDGGLPSDQSADWPSLAEVRGYVNRVRNTLDATLDRSGELTLLNVAIEHRLMHAETLAYMLHQLPFEDKAYHNGPPVASAGPVEFRMIEIPSGIATLGLSRNDAASFGWDNEYEAHLVAVPAFAIDQFKVTNGQYQQFMDAGGYDDASLWSPVDWTWKTEQNITQPVFWLRRGGKWFLRSMFEEIPLPAEWPVYVSHAEASAYARWAGKKLPSEAQWHRAAYVSHDGAENAYPWGSEAPSRHHGYFDSQKWDPSPVNAFPRGRSAFDVAGLLGNGWEWTSSVFTPFGGFQPFPFYPGYSANFFDGKHYVMKGGSPRTEACMLRRSFRNWFQPHYQYVYAGFRCVSE
jgi:gamma-glutamyl hercynylcysteine S-oxide synthase